jgi:hypothetical protein
METVALIHLTIDCTRPLTDAQIERIAHAAKAAAEAEAYFLPTDVDVLITSTEDNLG